ncbi:hypothetical protein ATANTOWER_021130 [Ataeniobius toweri]|uniref:Secreted protein n=1 Tax=Ataeniobius toweri TaxID=208326 RepID=A0ABU7BR80_9TELE|nr:hypothetical protein [Ataeniobius toweri]
MLRFILGVTTIRLFSLIFDLLCGGTVVTVVVVCLVTGGLPLCPSQSLCPWAEHFTHLPCCWMSEGSMVPNVWQPHFCQSAPGQLWQHCSSPLPVCECLYEWVDG